MGHSWGKVEYNDVYDGNKYVPSERIVKIGPIQWRDKYNGKGYTNIDRTIGFGNSKWTDKNIGPEFVTTTHTRIQQSYHIETIRGVSKITPLPNSKIGTLNYGNLENRLYIPRATWYMPKTTISVPQTRYYIPKTSYSVPRIK